MEQLFASLLQLVLLLPSSDVLFFNANYGPLFVSILYQFSNVYYLQRKKLISPQSNIM